MTDPDGSAFFAGRVGSADATLQWAEDLDGGAGLWHCLTQEAGCEAVFEYVVCWLLARA